MFSSKDFSASVGCRPLGEASKNSALGPNGHAAGQVLIQVQKICARACSEYKLYSAVYKSENNT